MTYKELLEVLNNMSDEQKDMDALFSSNGENAIISMVSQVLVGDTEEDSLEAGQIILS